MKMRESLLVIQSYLAEFFSPSMWKYFIVVEVIMIASFYKAQISGYLK